MGVLRAPGLARPGQASSRGPGPSQHWLVEGWAGGCVEGCATGTTAGPDGMRTYRPAGHRAKSP